MRKLFNLSVVWLLFIPAFCWAQLIESVPYFSGVDEPVVVYFRADEGSRGLQDFQGDVYAHTGVITENSTNPSDWKYVKTNWGQNTPETKLEKLEENLYAFTIPTSVRQFYNVPQGESILQVAFVFRSASPVGGSYLEGKTSANGDIYLEVFEDDPGFIIDISKPADNAVFLSGEIMDVRFYVSHEGEYTLTFGDYEETFHVENVREIEIEVTEEGTSPLIVTGPQDASDRVSVTVIGQQVVEDPPVNFLLGAGYLENGDVRFVLEAPGKGSVFLTGSFSEWEIRGENQLKRSNDGRYFWTEKNFQPGEEVLYQYIVDGQRYADPLSELVLDPFNDQFISPATYPDMPQYTAGVSGDISVIYPGKPAFNWQNDDFERPEPKDLIIYELLMRDFLAEHDYQTLIDTLPYFSKLGINVIELMPNNEFDGNISWGYNPAYHMALDKYYGSPDDFRRFVDAAHGAGIAVVVDVVFNHVTGRSPLAQMYWNSAANRPAADNPWMNETERHPFNVFNDMNHESEATQRYMDRCIKFLLDEYKIDGFRFDLSKGFTQKFTTDVGAWSSYDAGRVLLLKRMRDEIRSYSPDSYLILEHFGDTQEEVELASFGYLLWTNVTRNYHHAAMGIHTGGNSNLDGAHYNQRGFNTPALVSFIESHDEERVMYEVLNYGAGNASYNTRDFNNAVNRVRTLNAFHYLVPGPKMLWQFGELAYEFPINYCENGTVSDNCRTSPKPIRWDYYTDNVRKELFNGTADIIHLRNRSSAFDLPPLSRNLTGAYKFMVYANENEAAVVAGNFDLVNRQQTLTFPLDGWYYDYFSGDSILIAGESFAIPLSPGDLRIYTNVRYDLVSGDFPVSQDYQINKEPGMIIYPNPLYNSRIHIDFSEPVLLNAIQWFGPDGRMIEKRNVGQSGNQFQFDAPGMLTGFYLLRIETDKGVAIHKILVP